MREIPWHLIWNDGKDFGLKMCNIYKFRITWVCVGWCNCIVVLSKISVAKGHSCSASSGFASTSPAIVHIEHRCDGDRQTHLSSPVNATTHTQRELNSYIHFAGWIIMLNRWWHYAPQQPTVHPPIRLMPLALCATCAKCDTGKRYISDCVRVWVICVCVCWYLCSHQENMPHY